MTAASNAAETIGVAVADASERERYELYVDGELAGFTEYKTRRGIIAFIHTEVDEAFQGSRAGRPPGRRRA